MHYFFLKLITVAWLCVLGEKRSLPSLLLGAGAVAGQGEVSSLSMGEVGPLRVAGSSVARPTTQGLVLVLARARQPQEMLLEGAGAAGQE